LQHIIDNRRNEAKMHLQLSKITKSRLSLLPMLQVLVAFGFGFGFFG